jgi:methylthioribose-1-phosphate isomerase
VSRQTNSIDNVELLQAALEGLEVQRRRIDDQISTVKSMLGRKAPAIAVSAAIPAVKAARKRELSASARKRIAAAQKKRWAEYRKNQPAKE